MATYRDWTFSDYKSQKHRENPVRMSLALIAVAMSGALALAISPSPAYAQGVSGDFVLQAMTHTPEWPNATDVNPWDGQSNGTFVYRGIPCSGNAPMNNISSNLPSYSNRIQDGRSPASTRSHPMRFTVESGAIKGTIAFTVCRLRPGPTDDDVKDSDRPKIYVEFTATPKKVNAEALTFKGEFHIAGGTGRYEKLTGKGVISGYMFCYDPKGCVANQNRYRDMQFVLEGAYTDPAFTH